MDGCSCIAHETVGKSLHKRMEELKRLKARWKKRRVEPTISGRPTDLKDSYLAIHGEIDVEWGQLSTKMKSRYQEILPT